VVVLLHKYCSREEIYWNGGFCFLHGIYLGRFSLRGKAMKLARTPCAHIFHVGGFPRVFIVSYVDLNISVELLLIGPIKFLCVF
jgi:hypothetical protein